MKYAKAKQQIYSSLAKLLITVMLFGLFTTQLPTAFATENEDIIEEILEMDDEELEDDLASPASSSMGIQSRMVGTASNANVTEHIEFTATLSNSSGTISTDDQLAPTYWSSFTFDIAWAATPSNSGIQAGDFFTFTIPDVFAEEGSIPITDPNTGKVLGTLSFKADDTDSTRAIATVTFSDNANNLVDLSGKITLSAIYTGTVDKDPIVWVFDFSEGIGEEYTYTGEANIGPFGNGVKIDEEVYKGGSRYSTDIYSWVICANALMEDWAGVVTVTDKINAGHKLTEHQAGNKYSNGEINSAEGFYGTDEVAYFQIYLYDWNAMREDYNLLFGNAGTASPGDADCYMTETTIFCKAYSDFVYKRYVTQDAEGNVSYNIPDNIVTEYMYDAMRDVKDSNGNRKYREPYTEGLTNVKVTDSGFVLEFPKDALKGRSPRITYYTKLTTQMEIQYLTNDVTVTVAGEEYSNDAKCKVTAVAWATGKSGTISLYKYGETEDNLLAGAKFKLTNSLGENTTVITSADGSVAFELTTLPYTGVGNGTYTLEEIEAPAGYEVAEKITLKVDTGTYQIIEVNGEPVDLETGMSFDIGRIAPEGRAMAVYNTKKESTPEPVSLQLTGIKNLSGAALTDDMFSFDVLDADGNIVATGSNTAGGIINFSDIIFEKKGTYAYTVQEEDGGKPGYTYDTTTTYSVNVVVEEDNGVLIISSLVIGGEGGIGYTAEDLSEVIEFNNKYGISPATLQLTGKKNLSGATLTDGRFSFIVVSDTNNDTIAIGSNKADGSITFSEITFDQAGTYTYTVSEVNNNISGYTYDPKSYDVVVQVEDTGGKLDITSLSVDGVSYDVDGGLGDIIVFNNTYTPTTTESTSVTLKLTGNKTLTGKTLTDEMFNFIVSDVDNNTVATAYNKADGTVTFSDITLKQAGTYTYTITEINSKKTNYTYDSVNYTVVVQVEDIDGKLVITSLSVDGVDYDVDGDLKEIIKFNNKYSTGGGGGGGGGGGTTPGTPTTPTDPADPTTPTTPATPDLPPTTSGNNLVPNDDGSYYEVDDNGVALGRWYQDEDGTWIFDEMVPLAGLSKTGEQNAQWLILLMLMSGLGGAAIVCKRRKDKKA